MKYGLDLYGIAKHSGRQQPQAQIYMQLCVRVFVYKQCHGHALVPYVAACTTTVIYLLLLHHCTKSTLF